MHGGGPSSAHNGRPDNYGEQPLTAHWSHFGASIIKYVLIVLVTDPFIRLYSLRNLSSPSDTNQNPVKAEC